MNFTSCSLPCPFHAEHQAGKLRIQILRAVSGKVLQGWLMLKKIEADRSRFNSQYVVVDRSLLQSEVTSCDRSLLELTSSCHLQCVDV